MRSEPDDSDPYSFDGSEIMGCTGCQIDWKKEKNVSLKTKKQKHKGRGTVQTVTKTVCNDSLFLPLLKFLSGDLDDEATAILAADFETSHFLREHIILKLVLYFTGEAIQDDDDDEYDEGEDDNKNNPTMAQEGSKPSRVPAAVKQDGCGLVVTCTGHLLLPWKG